LARKRNNNQEEKGESPQSPPPPSPGMLCTSNSLSISFSNYDSIQSIVVIYNSFIHSQEHDVNNNRPTSNPFPPESPSQARSNSTLLENNNNVAQQLPNFGTELVRPNFVYY
jgi:hypothetical protein